MYLTKVTDQDIINLYRIVPVLEKYGLSASFIRASIQHATTDVGIYNLLMLFSETSEKNERDDIVADIQDLLDDSSLEKREEGVYIRFDDLDMIAKHIVAFKNSLLMKVNTELGGITRLAELTGIPQPSLSRFFNSASMPRRTTLLKIARAMNLSQVEIASEWIA